MECGTRLYLGTSEKRNIYNPQNVSVVSVMPMVTGFLDVLSRRFCSFETLLDAPEVQEIPEITEVDELQMRNALTRKHLN